MKASFAWNLQSHCVEVAFQIRLHICGVNFSNNISIIKMRKTEHEMTFGWEKFSDLHCSHYWKMHLWNFSSPFGRIQYLAPPPPLLMHNNPSCICPKNFAPTMKRFPCFMVETLGLWCMQVGVHNTLFSCVMFEENNMNFMNPCGNEIMQHNYGKMQKKIVFWKWIFFCLDFTIATQQNTVAYSEKTFP